MNVRLLIVLLLTLAFTGPAFAQREKLKPGDKAPDIDVDTWVVGEPVKLGQNEVIFLMFIGKLDVEGRFVMELLKLINDALEAEGVRLAVVTAEAKEDVEDFARRHRGEFRFALGADKRGKTKNEWLTAARIKGDLAVFIIGRNDKIMVINTPETANRQADAKRYASIMDRVLRGRYDPVLEPSAESRLTEAERSRKIKNWKIAEKLYDDTIAMDKTVFADVAMRKFELRLVDRDEPDSAYSYANRLIEEDYRSDVQFLCDLAEKIVADPVIPDASRRYDVALKAVNLALESVAPYHRYRVLAVMAKVHYRGGDYAKAVDYQRQAWFQATPRMKAAYKHTLDSYDAAFRRAGAGKPIQMPVEAQSVGTEAPPPARKPTPAAKPLEPENKEEGGG